MRTPEDGAGRAGEDGEVEQLRREVTSLRERLDRQAAWLRFPGYDLHAPIAATYAWFVGGEAPARSRDQLGAILALLRDRLLTTTRVRRVVDEEIRRYWGVSVDAVEDLAARVADRLSGWITALRPEEIGALQWVRGGGTIDTDPEAQRRHPDSPSALATAVIDRLIRAQRHHPPSAVDLAEDLDRLEVTAGWLLRKDPAVSMTHADEVAHGERLARVVAVLRAGGGLAPAVRGPAAGDRGRPAGRAGSPGPTPDARPREDYDDSAVDQFACTLAGRRWRPSSTHAILVAATRAAVAAVPARRDGLVHASDVVALLLAVQDAVRDATGDPREGAPRAGAPRASAPVAALLLAARDVAQAPPGPTPPASVAEPVGDLAALRSIVGHLAVRRDERWLAADPRELEKHLPSGWRARPTWLLLACLDLMGIGPADCRGASSGPSSAGGQ